MEGFEIADTVTGSSNSSIQAAPGCALPCRLGLRSREENERQVQLPEDGARGPPMPAHPPCDATPLDVVDTGVLLAEAATEACRHQGGEARRDEGAGASGVRPGVGGRTRV